MNNLWKKILILLSGYVSFIAFAVVGGIVFFKTDDEELKKTAKLTLILSLIFLGVTAFFVLYNYIGLMFSNYMSSPAYSVYSICLCIIGVAQVVVFATFIIMELVRGLRKKEQVEEKNDEKKTEIE